MGLGYTSPGCCNCGKDYLFALGTVCPPGALGGIAVTITGPGYSQTHTTDGSGHATFTGIFDGLTYTISFPTPPAPFTPPRYTQGTTTFTPPTVIPLHIGSGMTPAPGYLCSCSCNRPISNRMTLVAATDLVGGTETITLTPGFSPGWTGESSCDHYHGLSPTFGSYYDFYYTEVNNRYAMDGTIGGRLATGSTCDPFEAHYHGVPPFEADITYWSVTEGTAVP